MTDLVTTIRFVDPTRVSPAPALFELCVEAAEMTDLVDGLPDYREITRAVLGTVLDHTLSPYTVDELTRVLAEGAR